MRRNVLKCLKQRKQQAAEVQSKLRERAKWEQMTADEVDRATDLAEV